MLPNYNVFQNQDMDANLENTRVRISKKLDEITGLIEATGSIVDQNRVAGIKEKLLYMVAIYSLTPGQYTQLQESWHNHFLKLERTLNLVYEADGYMFNQHAAGLVDVLIEYDSTLLEQYLQLIIEGLYQGIFNAKAIPVLKLKEANSKILYSIQTVEEFFYKLTKVSKRLSLTLMNDFFNIQNIFKKMEKANLPADISSYFILLAQILDKMQGMSELDNEAISRIICTTNNVLNAINKIALIAADKNDNLLVCNTQPPLKKIKIVVESSEDKIAWEKLNGILIKAYAWYYNHYQGILAVETCDWIHFTLLEIRKLQQTFPQDFSGIFVEFLQDATSFSNASQYYHNIEDVDLLAQELQGLHQKVTALHFQMQACVLYNSICCDKSLPQETWGNPLASIQNCLDIFYEQAENNPSQNEVYKNITINIENLKNEFDVLGTILSLGDQFDENQLMVVGYIKQCIIGLDNLLRNSTETRNLKPGLLVGMVDTIKMLQTNLSGWLNNSLENLDNIYIPKRMQYEKEEVQPKKTSDMIIVNNPILKNSIPYNLYFTTYSKQKDTFPFSFFSERKSGKDLRKIAKNYDVVCHDVAGNGACLFSAFSLAADIRDWHPDFANLNLRQFTLRQSADLLRQKAVQYMKDNAIDYMYWIPNQDNKKDYTPEENFDLYLEKSKKSDEWGDHFHLDALCKLLKINIVVLNSDGSEPIILKCDNAVRSICLGLEINEKQVGIHYQALIPKDNSNQLPAKVLALFEQKQNKIIQSHKM